jgi:phytoene dehydrogenase-like protein
MKRREILSLLLGAPLAAEACRYLPTRKFEGEVRGANMGSGHVLRAGRPPSLEDVPRDEAHTMRVDTAIVGAGASGLSAAWRLERLGAPRYAVFELEAEAGGTSISGRDGVVPYPWGAHYVPLPSSQNRALVALLSELGVLEPRQEGHEGAVVARETALVREPEERLFVNGRWEEGLFPLRASSAEDRAELARFTAETIEWARRKDGRGRRAFDLPLARSSDDAEFTGLDRRTAGEYLRQKGYRSKSLHWYVDYACRDDYGLGLWQTSAWAMLFYFAARLREPDHVAPPFVTFPEGNGRLIRHLSNIAGDRLRTGKLVTDVAVYDDRVELAVFDAKSRELSRCVAARAVLAVPRFVVPRILRPLRGEPAPSSFAAFSFGSWMVANLHLKARPRSPGFPFAWDNVLYDSPSLGYVVATHQALADDGPTVWTYYQPFTDADPKAARERLAAADHGGFCDAIVADLSRAHVGLEDAIERIDVYRWGHAMVRAVPGLIWGDARRGATRSAGRVHFAHSDLSGVALFEEAQYHGVRAAEEVARAGGREFPSLLD